MENIKGLLLAAGFGTRLSPLTCQLPKPLFPVLNRPIIVHVIERMRSAGIFDIVINLHHQASQIRDYLGDGTRFGVNISYLFEQRLLGTGGVLTAIKDFWRDATLLVVPADMLSTLDLESMLQFHRNHGAAASVGTYVHCWPLHEWGGDVAALHPHSTRVQEFQTKPRAAARGRNACTGTWMFEPEAVNLLPTSESFDLNGGTLRRIVEAGQLHAFANDHEFADFGQPEIYIIGSALALQGELGIRPAEPEIRPNIFVADDAHIHVTAELVAPVLIGPGTIIGPNSRVVGPTVIGGGCTIGSGAVVQHSVLLPGVNIPDAMVLHHAFIADMNHTISATHRHHLDR